MIGMESGVIFWKDSEQDKMEISDTTSKAKNTSDCAREGEEK